MKTSPTHFEQFKTYAEEWQKFFGLTNWSLYFKHQKDTDKYASVTWSMGDSVAVMTLSKDWDEYREITGDELKRAALHEVLHVLLAELVALAEARYVSRDEIDRSEHSTLRRLESAIWGQTNA